MGKYRALRKLNCLLRTWTAIVAAHCPTVARIDLPPFEVAYRIAIASGMAVPHLIGCGSAILPELDTS
ncbi:MAG: hypothetical protein ACYC7J_17545 [Syntrophales bacterium]